MKKAIYYIGSNNTTKELETVRIAGIIQAHFDGFTATEVIGYWKGQNERTLKVEIVTEEKDTVLVKIGKELKQKLDQESVLLEIVQTNVAFIQ